MKSDVEVIYEFMGSKPPEGHWRWDWEQSLYVWDTTCPLTLDQLYDVAAKLSPGQLDEYFQKVITANVHLNAENGIKILADILRG